MKNLLCLCVLAASLVAAYSQNCVLWVAPTTPGTTYTSDFPAGFRNIIIPNPEDDEADPCIFISAGLDTQYLEVLIETSDLGGSNICIKVDDNQPTCSSGSASYCDKLPNNQQVTVTFTCVSGCDISDVKINYRANVSTSDFDDENWCQNRIKDYPSSLISFISPSDITPQIQFTESALGLNSFSFTVVLLIATAVLVLHQAIGGIY